MSGTYDFIDGAVDSLKQGGHPFLLIALDPRTEEGAFRYSIRSGVANAKDCDRLEQVVEDLLPKYLEDIRNG